jgi:hypothetical protein
VGLDDAIRDASAKQAANSAALREADIAWAAQAMAYQTRTAELTKDFLSRVARAPIPSKTICWDEEHLERKHNWFGTLISTELVRAGQRQGWQLVRPSIWDNSSLFLLATGEYLTCRGPDLAGLYGRYCNHGSDGKLVHCRCPEMTGSHWGSKAFGVHVAPNGPRSSEFEYHYLNPAKVEQSMAYFLVNQTPIMSSDLRN